MFSFFNGTVNHRRHAFLCSNLPGYFGATWDTQFTSPGGGGGGARNGDATLSQLAGYYNVNYTGGGKFGGGASTSYSGYSFGSGSYVDIEVDPSDTGWYLDSSNEWTVEFWAKTNHNYFNTDYTYPSLKMFGIGGASTTDLYLGEEDQTSFQKTKQQLFLWKGNTHVTIGYYGVIDSTWRHNAIVSDGAGGIKYYSNGALKVTTTWSNSSNHRKVHFGMRGANNQTRVYYFDEIRISDNQRYTANFTAPSAAFSDDSNTLALFHFDSSATYADDDAT